MRALLLGCMAALAIACDGSTSTPTGPTEVTLTTQTFAGGLATGASRFYSFTVNAGGTVSLMLASVTSQADGSVLAQPLEIGVGIPAGTGCSVSIAKSSAPGLVAQLQTSANPGVHCVRVSDTHGLAAPVNFSLRFTHP
jgi:hypothetical protein